MRCSPYNNRGFTLIELMLAITLFGLAITGMYSVYSSMQKTTVNQENLVDIQQNLRVALDMLSKDIKMAETLIPAAATGINAGSNATSLALQTASGFYAFARIASDEEVTTAETTQQFDITVPTSVDLFEVGHAVRIIRPQDGNQPYDPLNDASNNRELVVTSAVRTGPTITIGNFAPAADIQYLTGDIIARVSTADDAPDPSTIVWNLNGTDLQRNRDNTGANVIASDISNLTFSYLLDETNLDNISGTDDDDGEVSTPIAIHREHIRSVRVTITANATRQRDGQTRQRSLSSLIYLRN